MSQQPSSHAALVSELSTLYEISSLSNLLTLDQLGHDALEKALRLFGVRRFALWSGSLDARRILAMSGLRDADSGLARARQEADNIFAEELGTDGELGLLFMEKSTAITPRERRIYGIYFRRLEECLLTVQSNMERQRAREALALSEQRYRAMFENTGTAIIILDEDRTICLVNKMCEELLGYGRDEVVGKKKWAEFMDDPVELEQVMPLSRESQKAVRRTRSYELRLRRGDGTVRTVWVAASSIPGSSQTIASLIDITDRREAEQALRESEEKFRALFEQSVDAVNLVSPEGKLIEANPAWFALFGYTVEDTKSFAVRDAYVEPEGRGRFLQAIAGKDRLEDEMQFKRKDGTVFDCHRVVTVRRGSDGSSIGYQTVFHDVTEPKRAERALRQSEDKFRSLFEQIGDAININAPDGTMLDANQAFHDLFGYTREDLSSLNAVDVYANPADREDFLRRMAKTGFVKDVVRFRRKDGSVFDCERTAMARKDESGAIVVHLGINRDITERKRMEERIVEANRELRELTARLETAREEERAEVAWELHDHVAQALSVLKVDVDTCRRRLSEEALAGLSPVMDGMMHVLDETVGRLRRLYEDLVPVMLDDLGLAATIEWQAEEFARLSGIECEPRRVEDVKLPHGRVALGLFRVLQEALDNVQRHSGATKVTVDFERVGRDAVLRVADNGRGFTEADARKPGAIGLTSIRERAQSWEGRMSVTSTVGAGTVLEVTAPLEDEPVGKTAQESPGI